MSRHEEDAAGLLAEGSRALNLGLSDEVINGLVLYCTELQRWSRKINLIARDTSMRQIIENHFLDSLLLLPFLGRPDISLLDVGTGAGFPGLACKIALPALVLTLVEPRLKRVSFLHHIVRTLGASDVEIVAKRIEEIPIGQMKYDYITSRAVADIREFLPMVTSLAGPETDIVCMKGPKWQLELESAAARLKELDLVLKGAETFELPFSGARRALLVFRRRSG